MVTLWSSCITVLFRDSNGETTINYQIMAASQFLTVYLHDVETRFNLLVQFTLDHEPRNRPHLCHQC